MPVLILERHEFLEHPLPVVIALCLGNLGHAPGDGGGPVDTNVLEELGTFGCEG